MPNKSWKIRFGQILTLVSAIVLSCFKAFPAEGFQDSLQATFTDTIQEAFPAPSGYDPVETMPFLFKAIVLLGLLTLGLYFGLRIYKHLMFTKGGQRNHFEVKVLSSTMLAPKKTVHVLTALDHIFVVGVTENQMTLLLEKPQSELSEEHRENLAEDKQEPITPFSNILQDWMKRGKGE